MYDAEKQMLREIVWFLLGMNPDQRCCFCGKPLLVAINMNRTFGHRRHTSVPIKLTLHHRDENRDNNAPANLNIVHRACHKRHHNQERSHSNENPTS